MSKSGKRRTQIEVEAEGPEPRRLTVVSSASGESPNEAARRGLGRELLWLVPVGIAAGGLTVFLLTQGKGGSEIANTLSLPVSIAAVAAAVVLARMDRPTSAPAPAPGWQTWKLLTALLMTAAVSAAAAIVAVRALQPPDVQPSAKCSAEIRRDPARYLSGRLTIGLNGRVPGWSIGDGEDISKWDGFDVELARFIAIRHGLDPARDLKFDRLLSADRERFLGIDPLTQDCKVHLVISAYSMTTQRDRGSLTSAETQSDQPVRRPAIDFAGPYFQTKRGTAQNVSKVPQGTKIVASQTCVTKGTTAQEDLGPDAPVRKDTIKECMDLLFAQGDNTVAAVTTDVTLLRGYVAAQDDKSKQNVVVTEDPTSAQEIYGIGIPDGSPELCHVLSQDIAAFLYQNQNGAAKPTWNMVFDNKLAGPDPFKHKPSSVDLSWCHA